MKKILYIALLFLMPAFVSCVEDLGNDAISEINEIEISGIEESYSVISQMETLEITPELKGSLSASDESDLEYKWFLCNNGITDHKHEVISTQKSLSYPVLANPSTYTLVFSVLDKTTGLKWEKSTALNIVSPSVRGFYLFGDKADGTVGLDMISMIDGREPEVITDILKNTKGLKGAQNLIFTGYYAYTADANSLWAITESGSYQLENSASLASLGILDYPASGDDFIFPTIPVQKPMKVVELYPHSYGNTNVNNARQKRIIMTEDACYAGVFYTWPEAYGNPFNRMSTSSNILFKPSKYVFYQNSTYITNYCFYDETNKQFVTLPSGFSYTAPTYCKAITNSGTPYYFDQKQYEAVRDLVYGENGYANGRSYALMTDTDGNYFVYWMRVASSVSAQAEHTIDLNVATEFAQSNYYAFYSMQPIVLYAVGAKLYAYDYVRHDCKLVNTFDGDITYLAIDYNSNNDTNHVLVATYDGSKGKVYGYNVEDNQNAVNVTPVEGEVFETDLKIVKIEYRNAAN